MRKRHITIMILGDAGRRMSHIRLSRRVLTFGAASLGVLVAAGLAGGGVSLMHWAQRNQLQRLTEENRVLEREIGRIEVTVSQCRQAMDRQIETANALCVAANLEPLQGEVWQAGVGGRTSGIPASVESVREPYRMRLAAAGDQVESLIRQVEIQKSLYLEIEQNYVAQRDQWARTPSILPVDEPRITGRFGRRNDPFTGERRMHTGIDFSVPQGRQVVATADGVVKTAAREVHYGLLVELDHGGGLCTRYAHCSELRVRAGQAVKRGDVIALSGQTGRTTAPHLHYEVTLHGQPVNPEAYILPDGVIVD